jgi:uncharacterized protein YecT (DUF1311 family)
MRFLTLIALMIHSLPAIAFAQDESQLRTAVREHYKDEDVTVEFRFAFADLDTDDIKDAVVLMSGGRSCGSGGCNMLVFRGTKAGFTYVSSSTITNAPLKVLPERNAGWRSIVVYAKTVGEVVMRFDGKGYPLNPSTQPKATTAQLSLARTILRQLVLLSDWTYTEEVQFESLAEPNGVEFRDGRSATVSYGQGGEGFHARAEKWPKGKRLLIAYSSDNGSALVDPETDDYVSILHMSKDHPIDRIGERCLKANTSTSGMVSCIDAGLLMWDKELNRIYSQLIASISPLQKLAVQTAQREWIQYRDAQRAAITALYAAPTAGTVSRINRASAIADLTKEQAQRLGILLGNIAP